MKKILIINNDLDTMSLLKDWLERKNYAVKYTGSREEVYALMKDFNPQLVIIDSQQREVAEQVKQDAETFSIPVLMMTGYTVQHTNTILNGNDVIEKPFNLAVLEKKIEKLLAER